MKNLEVFHRLVYGEGDLLVHSAAIQQQRTDYLKSKYSKFTQHYRFWIEETNNNYRIREHQQFVFAELPVAFAHRRGTKIGVDQLPEALQKLLSDKLAGSYCAITNLHSHKTEGFVLEVTTSEDYVVLSAQQIRFYYYWLLLDEALAVIKKRLRKRVFTLVCEKQIRKHIRRYQTALSAYSNSILSGPLSSCQPVKFYSISDVKDLSDLYKLTFQKLEEVRAYLEGTFYNYLDTSLPVSYGGKLWLVSTQRERLRSLLNRLEKLKLPKSLTSLVALPLKNVINFPALDFSYRDQQYHITYVDALTQTLNQATDPCEQTIVRFLKEVNFNDTRFFRYATGRIFDKIERQDAVAQKLETLYYYEKCLKELPASTTCRYNQALPLFEEQMSGWLAENISFYKRKLKREKTTTSLAEMPAERTSKQTLRISVADIALLVRLLYENDLLEGTRKSALNFVCNHYRTSRTPTIAYDSLDRKYYDVPQSAKRKIRKLLKCMLAQLDEKIK